MALGARRTVQAHLVGQVCCFDTPRNAHNRVLVGRGALSPNRAFAAGQAASNQGGLAHHGLGTLGAVHGSRWDAGPFGGTMIRATTL